MLTEYTDLVCGFKPLYTTLDIPSRSAVLENMPMGYSDNIAKLRKKLGLTQAELAERVGVEQPTVQRWESGKREPNFAALEELSKALGVEPGAFFSDNLIAPLGPSLFVKGEVAAGVWREAFELPADEWRTFPGRPDVSADVKHRFGLRVVGDSMDQLYPSGTIVECVSVFGQAEIVSGKRVVVIRQRDDLEYEATVKEYYVDPEGRHWLLPRSNNPGFAPIQLGAEDPGIIETRITAIVVGSYRPE